MKVIKTKKVSQVTNLSVCSSLSGVYYICNLLGAKVNDQEFDTKEEAEAEIKLMISQRPNSLSTDNGDLSQNRRIYMSKNNSRSVKESQIKKWNDKELVFKVELDKDDNGQWVTERKGKILPRALAVEIESVFLKRREIMEPHGELIARIESSGYYDFGKRYDATGGPGYPPEHEDNRMVKSLTYLGESLSRRAIESFEEAFEDDIRKIENNIF